MWWAHTQSVTVLSYDPKIFKNFGITSDMLVLDNYWEQSIEKLLCSHFIESGWETQNWRKKATFLSFLFHFNLKPTIGIYILGKCNRVLQGWARKHIPVWLTLIHRPYTCQLSSWFSSRLPELSHMDRKWMKHPSDIATQHEGAERGAIPHSPPPDCCNNGKCHTIHHKKPD